MSGASGRVGLIGLGDMGGPIGDRILEAGFDLVVFDLHRPAVDRLAAAGATAAADAAELAGACEVVIVCVVDDGQVLDVVENSLAGKLATGSVLVVVSSVRPETVRSVAARLEPGGVQVLDVPVSGSRPAAAAGTLTLIVGGHAAVLARVRPVLESFGSQIFHVGECGAGQTVKIANNIMLHMNHLVSLEAVRFARAQGVDEQVLIEVVNTSSGRSWVTETWGLIDDMFSDHPQAGTMGIYGMMTKEMWNAVLLAKGNTAMPLTGVGVQVAQSLLADRERTLGLTPAEEQQ